VSAPIFVDGLHAFFEHFDGFIIDQWGVLHNGSAPYEGALEGIEHLKRHGKRLVLLTNSGRRASTNERRMRELGFDTGVLEGIVTSGEATWSALRDGLLPAFGNVGKRCYFVTNGSDMGPIEGLDIEPVDDIGDADFLYFTFLQSEIDDVPQFDPLLERALARNLPFLCSNPDRIAVTANGMTAAPGSVAARYGDMGGEVIYVGKPHRPIYEACLAHLDGVDHSRIVCIGDSIEHDIKGANNMNLASCFIENGIHKDAFDKGADAGQALEKLVAEHGGRPTYVMPGFRW